MLNYKQIWHGIKPIRWLNKFNLTKVYATTLSDSDSSDSESEESCDGEGNYSAFMTITHVESSNELNLLVRDLAEHSDEEYSDEESLGIVKESDAEEDESTINLQENYNSLLSRVSTQGWLRQL